MTHRLSIPLLVVLLLAGCTRSGAGDDVAAMVEDAPITVAELSDSYARFIFQAGLEQDDARVRHEVLQSLINRRLLVRAARDEGIAQTPEYARALDAARRRTLLQFYAQQVLYDTLTVRERDLRELFLRSNTEVTARHLYARTQAEAEALRTRLAAGETFDALAAEVFADPILSRNGGLVGTFGFDEMDPAFEAAAFRLPLGEISEPVRTAQGWSVLQVEDRFTKPILTETEFAQKKNQFRDYARKRARTEARFAHSRDLLAALRPTFDAAGLSALTAAARGETTARLETPLQQRPLVHFGPEGDRHTWTVGDVEALAASATERQLEAVNSPEALQEFVEGLVVREEMLRRARTMGLDQETAYAEAVEASMDEWVFDEAKQAVRTEVRVPEDSVRAHFAAHRASYLSPERVRVRELLVADRAEANRLRRQLDAGASFEALARAHTLRPGARSSGGDLGAVSRDELGVLAGPVFDAQPGATLGPLEIADRVALLRVGERLAPAPMSFEGARPLIEERLEVPFAQAALERTLGQLRTRYRVVVNEDAVRRVHLFS